MEVKKMDRMEMIEKLINLMGADNSTVKTFTLVATDENNYNYEFVESMYNLLMTPYEIDIKSRKIMGI
jgi:coenzyme F420-reducing hydrogenase delta subunit